MNRWIWGILGVCYCQTRPKWWKIDLDAVTLLGIWHEKGTNSAFALQGLHGSISWKDLLCCNRLCDNPDWCFFATLLWVKPKGDLIQWVKWQLRTVLQILLTVANLHKSRAANWSTRGLEPQHAWFRWSGEVWAVSANSQLSFSILWFHCPIHVTCPNWQRIKTPISSSCKTTLRNRHVPLATCTFVACSQLQPFATGQIYKTSTQLQCVPSVTDDPRFETLKVSANDFSQFSWSVGLLKETRTNLASCRWNLQTRASFGLAECLWQTKIAQNFCWNLHSMRWGSDVRVRLSLDSCRNNMTHDEQCIVVDVTVDKAAAIRKVDTW